MKYEAVIFDLFGTLIDNFSRQGYEDNLAEIAGLCDFNAGAFIKIWKSLYNQRVIGKISSPDGCIDFIGQKLRQQPSDIAIETATLLRDQFVKKTITPRPDTLKTLNELKKRGYRLALLSDCSSEIPIVWPATEFFGIFDVTTFSSNEGLKKPMPEIYQLTAERLNIPAEACVFVGDGGSQELTGAKAVGMRPIQIIDSADSGMQVDPDEWSGEQITRLGELLVTLSGIER
ncbi:HAD-IA family hydrolase [bacterium]|nr:HAD-IA family hydrolase [bacterium]